MSAIIPSMDEGGSMIVGKEDERAHSVTDEQIQRAAGEITREWIVGDSSSSWVVSVLRKHFAARTRE